MANIKQDSYDTGGDYNNQVYDDYWASQTFTSDNSFEVYSVKMYMARNTGTSGSDTCYVAIYAVDGDGKPTGSPLTDWSGLLYTEFYVHATYSWEEFVFTTRPLLAGGTQYAIVVRGSNASSSHSFYIKVDSTSATYSGGQYWQSTDAGSTWDDVSLGSDADGLFEVWGGAVSGDSYQTYPVDAITRVTSLTHRYNRAVGEYSLVAALGEVTTDFGIPTVDITLTSSSVQDQPKEEAKAVVKQAQDEVILPPKPKPKPLPLTPPPTPTPEPTPEPVTLTEYAEEVIRKQPYRAAAITQQVEKIPSRPTVYAYDILAAREQEVQRLEERQAAARLKTGRIATERTKAIITSSPEAQKRLKEIEEQRKSWWEFWK